MAHEQTSRKVYKVRTMEGDIEAQKKGSAPPNIPVAIESPDQKPPAPAQKPAESRTIISTPPAPQPSLGDRPISKPTPAPPPPSIPEVSPTRKQAGPPASRPASPLPRSKPLVPPKNKEGKIKKISPPTTDVIAPQPKGKKKLIILGIVAVLILAVIVGEVWWFFLRPGPQEPPIPPESFLPNPEDVLPPTTTEEEPTTQGEFRAFLAFVETEQFSTELTAQSFASSLDAALAQPHPAGTLVNLVPVASSTGQQLTLDELMSVMGITIPQSVRSELTGLYNFFALTPTPFDRATCSRAGISDSECSGSRLGLALEQREEGDLATALSAWEPSMPQNLRGLIRYPTTITPGSFLNATYGGVAIRYRNFPIDTITIDYAIRSNLLIVTTSKSSMFSAIDSL